jgi:hypothetical protein
MDPWSSFLPSLTASFLAILVGVPFGVFVTWVGIRIAQHHRERDEMELLKKTVQALMDSIINSGNVLFAVKSMLAQGATPFDPFLETDTWQTLRSFLIPLLDDPGTIREISAYFSNLDVMSRIITRLITYEQGPLRAGNTSDQRQFLIGRLDELIKDANQLTAKLEAVIATLDSQARARWFVRLAFSRSSRLHLPRLW